MCEIKKVGSGKIKTDENRLKKLERVMGIEPTQSAWKAEVLPLNYTRKSPRQEIIKCNEIICQVFFKNFFGIEINR